MIFCSDCLFSIPVHFYFLRGYYLFILFSTKSNLVATQRPRVPPAASDSRRPLRRLTLYRSGTPQSAGDPAASGLQGHGGFSSARRHRPPMMRAERSIRLPRREISARRCRSRKKGDEHDTQESSPAHKDPRRMRPTLYLAPPLGTLLGCGALLLPRLPTKPRGRRLIWTFETLF